MHLRLSSSAHVFRCQLAHSPGFLRKQSGSDQSIRSITLVRVGPSCSDGFQPRLVQLTHRDFMANLQFPHEHQLLLDCISHDLGCKRRSIGFVVRYCPDSCASFCTGHSSSIIGPASSFFDCSNDVLQCSSHTSLAELMWQTNSTIRWQLSGHDRAKLFRLRHSNSKPNFPKFATPWCFDPSCDEDLHAKIAGLARFANHRFPSTTSDGSLGLQGFSGTSGLVESMDCKSMDALHFGDPTQRIGRSVCKYLHW